MKKSSMVIVALSLVSMMASLWNTAKVAVSLEMPMVSMEQMAMPLSGLSWDSKSKIFLMMVMVVTTVVISYSEMYMEHYNNKKFMNMLLAFLVSMIALASSETVLNIMVGWEMLGLSSLLLIMFYPNKNGKGNSIMTMFFNRLGDVLLILILGESIVSHQSITTSLMMDHSIMMMLAICTMTKSAQFPMSAWLPAAMAAPTPISAMVHSSTLVTAGVFLVTKFHEQMSDAQVMSFLCAASMISFMLGSVMGSTEMDFKKMVAFSTMSQISMIMNFATLVTMTIAMTHMIYHAMFKTLLFCMSGVLFMGIWSSQVSMELSTKSNETTMWPMIVLSVFSMTGMIFSASFFTKDLFLEMELTESKSLVKVMFMMAASFMTMMYCIKMMKPLKETKKMPTVYELSSMKPMLVMMWLVILMLPFGSKAILTKDLNPLLNTAELTFMILMLMILPLVVNSLMLSKMEPLNFTLSVAFMKSVVYSMWSKEKSLILNLESDLLTIKKTLLTFKSSGEKMQWSHYPMGAIMLMILMTL